MSDRLYVVVSGPPASGKSTLAPALAQALGLPLVAKDTIKDALMSVQVVADEEASKQLGRAAIAAMLAVATESPIGAVIESSFHRSAALEEVGRLPGVVVEIFCRCDPAIAEHRYAARARLRHPGHFDHIRSREDLWNRENAEPIAGGWALVEVDTGRAVDVPAVVAFIRRARG